MTMTLPLRRITLHLSQMGFTDALTFIVFPPYATRLLEAVGDPSFG